MEQGFDLVVVGTGEAGSTAAHRLRSEGWKVAIVDKRPFGGTCALRGCDPKKVLVGVAELADWYQRIQGRGIAGQNVHLDWPSLMRFKRTFTDPVPEDREKGFQEAGIVTFHGTAQFVEPRTIQVGDQTLTGRCLVLATGARPQTLSIPGEEYLATSEQFLHLDTLPKQIVFVGGGYIAAEFAHVAARAGAEATIIHRGQRPLEGFDADLGCALAASHHGGEYHAGAQYGCCGGGEEGESSDGPRRKGSEAAHVRGGLGGARRRASAGDR